jgi:hypothetical protein
VAAIWQATLDASNQRSAEAPRVFLSNDRGRKGLLVGLKWHSSSSLPFVEILWDADGYKFEEICVEGSCDWRGQMRLEFAKKENLRVYQISDIRDNEKKRYGYIESMSPTEAFVIWDFSVPCLHRADEVIREKEGGKWQYGERVWMAGDSRIKGFGEVIEVVILSEQLYVTVFWNRDNTCGNLPVPGAFDDFSALQKLIDRQPELISEVFISRDCHRHNHISHKSFWYQYDLEPSSVTVAGSSSKLDDGSSVQAPETSRVRVGTPSHPANGTEINYIDVLTGKFRPVNPKLLVSLNIICRLIVVTAPMPI